MDDRFNRYLLRELYWELHQHDVGPQELKEFLPGQVEVLSHCGYASLQVRIASAVFDVGLSWRKETPPTIEKVAEDTVS